MIANSQQRRRSTFETNILKFFFLERASTSNFCCATNQNNPHILKYVSYDRSRLLQPCGKLFSWAPPVPLGKFKLLLSFNCWYFFFNKLCPLFHLKFFVFTENYDWRTGRKTRFCSKYISSSFH